MENATTFGSQAGTYSAARPSYPRALFDWIAGQAPGHACAWDVGCGSGQAARALAQDFTQVHATDLDPKQIAEAQTHPHIRFVTAPAHRSGLSAQSVDAVTVATALHWFDPAPFWEEVRRVARPGAVFCAWTYHRAVTEDDIRAHLMDPILEVVEPYWSDGNRLSWRGYDAGELQMPFEMWPTPAFACELRWTPAQIASFLRTWSAHAKARADGHATELERIESDALAKLGDAPRQFDLPLHVLAAIIR